MIVVTIANKFLITLNGLFFCLVGKSGALGWGGGSCWIMFFNFDFPFQFPNLDLPARFSYWNWLHELLMNFFNKYIFLLEQEIEDTRKMCTLFLKNTNDVFTTSLQIFNHFGFY